MSQSGMLRAWTVNIKQGTHTHLAWVHGAAVLPYLLPLLLQTRTRCSCDTLILPRWSISDLCKHSVCPSSSESACPATSQDPGIYTDTCPLHQNLHQMSFLFFSHHIPGLLHLTPSWTSDPWFIYLHQICRYVCPHTVNQISIALYMPISSGGNS